MKLNGPVGKNRVVDGLTDVLGHHSTHFQSIDEVRGLLQDGVVGHEVRGPHSAVVGLQVHGCGVSGVATGERGGAHVKNIAVRTGEDQRTPLSFQEDPLPFSTLGVGIVGQEHGQKPHEVVSDGPLLPSSRHRSTRHAGLVDHWRNTGNRRSMF